MSQNFFMITLSNFSINSLNKATIMLGSLDYHYAAENYLSNFSYI